MNSSYYITHNQQILLANKLLSSKVWNQQLFSIPKSPHKFIINSTVHAYCTIVAVDQKGEHELTFELTDHSSLTLVVIASPQDRLSSHINVNLHGEGSHVEVYVLTQVKGNSQTNLIINSIHQGSNTSSSMLVKTIADEQSLVSFTGSITIPKEVSKVTAEQYNHNLLLSKQARVLSKPFLYISNPDIQCKHGLTTAALDPQSLEFFQARGLDRKMAQKLLVAGFRDHILAQLDQVCLRKNIESLINLE